MPNTNKNTNKQPVVNLSTIRGRVTTENTTEWVRLDGSAFKLVLGAAQAVGGAVMFGATRDGSALVVTVMVGDQREKYYAGNDIAADDLLRDVAKVLLESVPAEVAQRVYEVAGLA